MGKEIENATKEIADILGMGEDDSVLDKKESESEDKKESESEDKKEETSQNITLSPEQLDITKEITKIDVEIEALSNKSVDTDKFYDNLDEHLSDDEQQLEFDNKIEYLKLIKTKEQEYIKANSKEEKIQELKTQQEELENTNLRASAVNEVSQKYPSYNHNEMMQFFEKGLNEYQKEEVFKDAKSYSDVYENTYKEYLKQNPQNIETAKAPDIPNLNNIRKQNVSTKDASEEYKTEDELMQEALGL